MNYRLFGFLQLKECCLQVVVQTVELWAEIGTMSIIVREAQVF